MLFANDLPIKFFPQGVLLHIKVTPNASRNKIGKILDDNLKIYVTALPENGQANKVVIKLLSECLNMGRNDISISQGLTSQYKVVSIVGDKENIVKALQIII